MHEVFISIETLQKPVLTLSFDVLSQSMPIAADNASVSLPALGLFAANATATTAWVNQTMRASVDGMLEVATQAISVASDAAMLAGDVASSVGDTLTSGMNDVVHAAAAQSWQNAKPSVSDFPADDLLYVKFGLCIAACAMLLWDQYQHASEEVIVTSVVNGQAAQPRVLNQ